jgi:hypothetical protein
MTLGPLQPVLGAVILLIAYALSTNRRAIRWSTVAWGLGLQIVFAIIVLKTSVGERVSHIPRHLHHQAARFRRRRFCLRLRALGDNAVWTR